MKELSITDEQVEAIFADLKKYKKNNTFDSKINVIVDQMFQAYTKETERGCQDLLLEWIKNRFWAKVIHTHVLPMFDESYALLLEKGHVGIKNSFDYGDMDVSVWIEKASERKQVIASTRHCSMADDNTHIYIKNTLWPEPENIWIKFRAVAVWPREIPANFRVGDRRAIKFPSINTFRKRDFEFGLNDGRDKCQVFKYEHMKTDIHETITSEDAAWTESKIESAIWTLKTNLEALKE